MPPQAPWDTNRHLRAQESAPSSLKGCSAHGGTRSSSEGLGRRLRGGGCTTGSVNPTAQAPEHRAPRHSPGSGLPPGQAEAGRAQDSKDAPAPS